MIRRSPFVHHSYCQRGGGSSNRYTHIKSYDIPYREQIPMLSSLLLQQQRRRLFIISNSINCGGAGGRWIHTTSRTGVGSTLPFRFLDDTTDYYTAPPPQQQQLWKRSQYSSSVSSQPPQEEESTTANTTTTTTNTNSDSDHVIVITPEEEEQERKVVPIRSTDVNHHTTLTNATTIESIHSSQYTTTTKMKEHPILGTVSKDEIQKEEVKHKRLSEVI
jgi:hypothetical protein